MLVETHHKQQQRQICQQKKKRGPKWCPDNWHNFGRWPSDRVISRRCTSSVIYIFRTENIIGVCVCRAPGGYAACAAPIALTRMYHVPLTADYSFFPSSDTCTLHTILFGGTFSVQLQHQHHMCAPIRFLCLLLFGIVWGLFVQRHN